FRRLSQPLDTSSAQISILNVGDEPRIYCCESVNVFDPAGNNRVLCAGIDLNPAISAQGGDAVSIAEELKSLCVASGGSSVIPP
ncbi:MerR family transcriptional regulator, partial [Vibrio parahaemolyticus]